ncbi:MAG: 30S ribosomal protein S14 [Gammaproteobacteria bacterium]|nr:30S ribosomal protein S14 [Gammaproteobacteria bacterium]MCY4226437.1 30S ribosomal protein S14 [Gammaproteobacteria bacterium]MCY4314358.1 30S ribosomal protein S14 [Gammaproteobacteria bacterium]
MAKKSMIAREEKRRKLVEACADKRNEVKSRVTNAELSVEERFQAMLDLQKFPRDASSSRVRNRCALTGRSRGYYRKFGLGRNKLREVIMRGEAPGVVKSSW